ncbi:MAG: FixH family protein [Candidatus Lambdaproteobacteria bacterium]|nr:FixH family protein [Candidatus Lambdaproteobacteria bacterium]
MKALIRGLAMGALTLGLAVPQARAQADRAKAELTCQPAQEQLMLDCALRLTNRRSGAPLEGARVSVHADMPSMPMAHNVPPVVAEPGGPPGMYRLRMMLAMAGEWTLRLNISGPLNDVVVTRVQIPLGSATDHAAMGDKQMPAGQQGGDQMQMPAGHGALDSKKKK